jgi:hypothetical protein
MSRKRFKGRIEGPFVPLLKDTLRAPAWKALSYGARCLYVVLKWRYNKNLGNAVFVSTRVAARELGAGRDNVRDWFRELEFYGFIFKVRLAHHGVNGHGKAPHWRLTEERYLGKEPTREFLHWDGSRIKRTRNAGRLHRLHALLKNRVRGPGVRSSVAPASGPLVPKSKAKNGTSGPGVKAISGNGTGPGVKAITSQPLGGAIAPVAGGTWGVLTPDSPTGGSS